MAELIGSHNQREIVVGLASNMERVIVNEQMKSHSLDSNQIFSQNAL
jgi:hypothetical protein